MSADFRGPENGATDSSLWLDESPRPQSVIDAEAEYGGQLPYAANAQLIAAAPELLDNLALSTRFLELEAEGHRLRGDVKKAEACEGQARQNRAAIAKALGESAI